MGGTTTGSVLEAVPFAAVVTDGAGAILHCNAEARTLLGAGSGSVAGNDVLETLARALAAPRDELAARLARPIANGMGASAVVQPAEPPAEEDVYFRIHVRSFDDAGLPHRLLIVERLVGERRVEARMHRLVGDVRSIQHQVNNVLMGLLGHTELLQLDASLDETLRGRVTQILDEGHRVREQVRLLGNALRRS